MHEMTLLERIEALDSKTADNADINLVDVEIQSIMGHLRKLLNTDRGSVQIDPEYGLPDMTVFSSGDQR